MLGTMCFCAPVFSWEELSRKQQLPDFTKAGSGNGEVPSVSVAVLLVPLIIQLSLA